MNQIEKLVFHRAFFILFLGLTIAGCSTRPPYAKWSDFKNPKIGRSESIGKVESGCLLGGQELQENENLLVMRKSRHRYFGHPDLIQFVSDWAKRYREETGRKVCVGDLAQPRGGPFYPVSNHRSHQSGIDADLWFEDFSDSISAKNTFNYDLSQDLAETETDLTEMVSSADVRSYFIESELNNSDFESNEIRERIIRSIFLAATDSKVERIFVNPVIKKYLCRQIPVMERYWVRKIRPWWGHEDHMHVRLFCPVKDQDCIGQTTIPEGDGCDETLDWWFTDEANEPSAEPATKSAKPESRFQLPERCETDVAIPEDFSRK